MKTKDKLEELKAAAHAAESVYTSAVDSRADREAWDTAYNYAREAWDTYDAACEVSEEID